MSFWDELITIYLPDEKIKKMSLVSKEIIYLLFQSSGS